MVTIDLKIFGAFIFDLDGVITETASIHARAWKRLFDEYLARRAAQTGTAFVPFDLETDYRRYVDGKPRLAGVLSFLASRDITIPVGSPGDQVKQETAHGLASEKDHYFAELLAREGVQVSASAVPFLHEARRRGVRVAVASSSRHCSEVLRTADLTALFDAQVDGIDIDRLGLSGKPSPDMFLEAAHRLGVIPARTVVFEDAAAGIAAARAGGFGLAIGIGGGKHVEALLESGADQVAADFTEVSLLDCCGHFCKAP
jgi:beta-phosphoglucomutase family hydrolase